MQLLKSPLFLASAASLLMLGGCNADQDATTAAVTPVESVEIVATVNGTPISKATIDLIATQEAGQSPTDTPEARAAITNQLIMQTLIAEEALKKGLDKSPAVTEQMNVIRLSVLSNAYIQDYLDNQKPSDDELKAEYERIKAGITGTEYKARHILVESEAQAQQIIDQLKKNPDDFAKLAEEKSLDTGSKNNGGDLGWFDLHSMVPEFGDAAAKLQKGQINEAPVKTEFGYHVIQLEDSRPIQAPPFDEVKPHLAESVQQQKLKTQVEELKAKAKIEMTDAPAAATEAAK
jgi:peptidyl-prolyl cis-trans isomerase C